MINPISAQKWQQIVHFRAIFMIFKRNVGKLSWLNSVRVCQTKTRFGEKPHRSIIIPNRDGKHHIALDTLDLKIVLKHFEELWSHLWWIMFIFIICSHIFVSVQTSYCIHWCIIWNKLLVEVGIDDEIAINVRSVLMEIEASSLWENKP